MSGSFLSFRIPRGPARSPCLRVRADPRCIRDSHALVISGQMNAAVHKRAVVDLVVLLSGVMESTVARETAEAARGQVGAVRFAQYRLALLEKSPLARAVLELPPRRQAGASSCRGTRRAGSSRLETARTQCLSVPESVPTESLLGAAPGGGGAFRSTNMYIPNTHAIAAVHPARMSDG
jgi:hypothetical protein